MFSRAQAWVMLAAASMVQEPKYPMTFHAAKADTLLQEFDKRFEIAWESGEWTRTT